MRRGVYAGVDVGGVRKGFHAAIVDSSRVVAGPSSLSAPADVVAWLRLHRPAVVAVDSPRRPAPDGELSREGERLLARAICGIRYTPDRARIETNPYYAWIRHGFELYAALETFDDWQLIECFPTASWTRWAGARGAVKRSVWSRRALGQRGLRETPGRLGQDGRDAIGAALTARVFGERLTDAFGEIVVPSA